MDIMELGAIGELVGGAAVLATLIYLAVQVTQSKRLALGASQRDVNNAFAVALDRMAEHRTLIINGIIDFEAMPKDDQYRFSFLMAPLVNHLDQALAMQHQGLETPESITFYADVVLAFLRCPGAAQWWEAARPFMGTPAGKYLDERLRRRESLPIRISEIPWFQPDDPRGEGA